jgi:hypothetical protein
MQPTEHKSTEHKPTEHKEREGPWTKFGVMIALVALLITYTGTASQAHWFPFSRSRNVASQHSSSHSRPSLHSSSHSSLSSSPPSSPPPSPSLPPSATFLSWRYLGLSSCGCYYQYFIRIDFSGLENQSPVVDWRTVYSATGLDGGTSGSVTVDSLSDNDETWWATINVKGPPEGAYWYIEFTVYAPNGTELDTYST